MHKETDNLNEDMPSIILHPEEMHRETVTADLLNEPISISVNRLKVRDDLIKAFKENEIALQQHINYTVIDPRGIPEAGVGAGVDRDVYSMFWSDVGNSLLIGAEQRVPFVRHDFYIQHWKSVGKILVKGFIDTGYLPTIVNYAFLHYCLFGELADDKLLSYFLLYLAADERNCVEKALKGNQDILQSDEFAEILEQFKCRTLITSENLQEVLIELARQELYQKPHIMASCWSELFGDLRNYINSPQALEDIYERLKPTNRKVISLIDCETKTDAERDVLGYLKRFIRSLNEGDLRKLIQFLTGSELLVISKISVAFYINDVSVLRHPIAHTCGPTLELPTSYNNFCEPREEFASILMQSTWGMDIV